MSSNVKESWEAKNYPFNGFNVVMVQGGSTQRASSVELAHARGNHIVYHAVYHMLPPHVTTCVYRMLPPGVPRGGSCTRTEPMSGVPSSRARHGCFMQRNPETLGQDLDPHQYTQTCEPIAQTAPVRQRSHVFRRLESLVPLFDLGICRAG
jgi:hypothetical protein